MPSYEYRCQECRSVFAIERSMKDCSDNCSCQSCGSTDVSRIWNAYIRTGGMTPDVGQGASKSQPKKSQGGCGSCSSSACGTCH
jgi:putative FmdB family regulatory protein